MEEEKKSRKLFRAMRFENRYAKLAVFASLFLVMIVFNVALAMAQVQSHRLSETRVIDKNLDMGSYQINTSQLNATNGYFRTNVGINTVSPASMLHVQGGMVVGNRTGGALPIANAGVYGSGNVGVYGISGVAAGTGVRGVSFASASRYGNLGDDSYGAYGQYDAGNYGYLGMNGYGVYGAGTSYAGYFLGNVTVTDSLYVKGGPASINGISVPFSVGDGTDAVGGYINSSMVGLLVDATDNSAVESAFGVMGRVINDSGTDTVKGTLGGYHNSYGWFGVRGIYDNSSGRPEGILGTRDHAGQFIGNVSVTQNLSVGSNICLGGVCRDTWPSGSGGGGVGGSGSTNHMAWWYNSTDVTYDSDGNFYWDSTNNRLGIGTTAPISKIHVQGGTIVGNSSGNGSLSSGIGVFGTGSSYSVYGRYNTTVYGYLAGRHAVYGNVGAYGEYNMFNWGILGSEQAGVFGKSNTMGGYFVNEDNDAYPNIEYGAFGGAEGSGGYDHRGLMGKATYADNNDYGVYGEAHDGTIDYGVYGNGSSYGVYGCDYDNCDTAYGYLGGGNYGVYGSGSSYGVYGNNSAGPNGALGTSVSGAVAVLNGSDYAYIAYNDSGDGYGVWARGSYMGVYGYFNSTNFGYLGGLAGVEGHGANYGVYGASATGFAGFFDGKVNVTGTLSARNITLNPNCADGQILKWSGGVGTCGTDDTLGGGAVTGGGSSGYGAMWNGTSSINRSVIYQDSSGRIGIGTTSPDSAFAVKYSCTGCGYGAAVIGSSSVSASGDYSVAMGYGSWTTGNYSFVAGQGNRAIGQSSTAFGYSSSAEGYVSFAAGSNANAGGSNSVALGSFANASGGAAFAVGATVNAYGSNSVAMGSLARAGDYSVAIGRMVNATGQLSTAIGYNNTASGQYSTAMGRNMTVTGVGSFGIGLDGGEYIISTNNVLSVMGGKVGINTTSPDQQLKVEGNANVTGTLFASNVSSNSPLQLQTKRTTRAYIDDNTGNFGIGTVSPGSRLHVVNGGSATTVQIGNDSIGKTYGVIQTSADTAGHFAIQSIRSSGSSWGDVVLNPNGGNVGIGTTGPSVALTLGGTAGPADLMLNTSGNDAGDIIFQAGSLQKGRIWTHGGAGVSGMYFSSGDITEDITIDNSGNVGIGTTNPASPLDVAGQVRINTTGESQFITGDTYIYMNPVANSYGRIGVYDTSAGPLSLLLQPAGGNVGINTTSPSGTLTVKGGSIVLKNASDNDAFSASVDGTVTLGGPSNKIGTSSTSYTYYQIGPLNDYDHHFYSRTNVGAASERFTIEGGAATAYVYFQNSYVGIGATSPAEELQIDSAADARIFVTSTNIGSGSPGYELGYGTTETSVMYRPKDTSDMRFYVNGADRIAINGSTGNVGIGTTSPSTNLEINESNADTTPALKIRQVGTGDAVLSLKAGANSYAMGVDATNGNFVLSYLLSGDADLDDSDYMVFEPNTGDVGFWTAPSAHFHIYNSGSQDSFRVDDILSDTSPFLIDAVGRVGVGLTTPSQTIAVAGSSCVAQDDATCDAQSTTAGNSYSTTRTGGSIDIAEWVKTEDASLEAGDVVIIDVDNSDKVKKSSKAYDTKVAGIVSTKPHLTMGAEYAGDDAVILALAGRVPLKVTAENGEILPGDLLTTSSKAGYAMKCDERCVLGTVVGKAMESHKQGEGKIRALVTLQ